MRHLAGLAQRLSGINLNEWMTPHRTAKLTLNAGDWTVDLSKHFLNDESLSALSQWANDRALDQAVSDLFAGQPLNLTENRAVLHMALRPKRGIPMA